MHNSIAVGVVFLEVAGIEEHRRKERGGERERREAEHSPGVWGGEGESAHAQSTCSLAYSPVGQCVALWPLCTTNTNFS